MSEPKSQDPMSSEQQHAGVTRSIPPDALEVTIGGKTAQQLIEELERAGHHIASYARAMFLHSSCILHPHPKRISLVLRTPRNFGITQRATLDTICRCAAEHGLGRCPADVGPSFLLQHHAALVGDHRWVSIAMDPIPGPIGDRPRVFSVGRDARARGGSWLGHDWAYPRTYWDPDDWFALAVASETL
ncbi:MAG: hypothetical protein Q7T01_02460 [bacterium]|nr:hypothetical protein [bacterium]